MKVWFNGKWDSSESPPIYGEAWAKRRGNGASDSAFAVHTVNMQGRLKSPKSAQFSSEVHKKRAANLQRVHSEHGGRLQRAVSTEVQTACRQEITSVCVATTRVVLRAFEALSPSRAGARGGPAGSLPGAANLRDCKLALKLTSL
ncbi:hypothetical protein TNCV_122781 [Trichonephila clavipes]|nr:hypothetical protein TNCV_122781 [Trichonephila clavipes]